LLIAGQGGLIGLALAKIVIPVISGALPMMSGLGLPPHMLVLGLLLALGVGAVAGFLPAIGAMRLRVAEALRRV
jgi:putative ABC transport system permease protein